MSAAFGVLALRALSPYLFLAMATLLLPLPTCSTPLTTCPFCLDAPALQAAHGKTAVAWGLCYSEGFANSNFARTNVFSANGPSLALAVGLILPPTTPVCASGATQMVQLGLYFVKDCTVAALLRCIGTTFVL